MVNAFVNELKLKLMYTIKYRVSSIKYTQYPELRIKNQVSTSKEGEEVLNE